MNPEEIAALKQLIAFLEEKKVGEFRLERGELKVELKFESAIAAAAQASASGNLAMDPVLLGRLLGSREPEPASLPPVAAASSPAAAEPSPAVEEALHTVKSPIVGTFYESPSPGSPAFIRIGDAIELGQPMCIVEAMKLMNEIESDVAGEVVKQLVHNGQPVEYGQPLFAVRVR